MLPRSSRALLSSLLAIAACADTENNSSSVASPVGSGGSAAGRSGAAGNASGAGGSAAAGAGTGGAGSGGAGSGVGGAHGGSGGISCPPFSQLFDSSICVDPTGKSLEPIYSYYNVYYVCSALAHDPDGVCPPVESACTASACDVNLLKVVGGPTKVGNDCCYNTAVCLGGSGCGRPLIAGGWARVARAAATADWI